MRVGDASSSTTERNGRGADGALDVRPVRVVVVSDEVRALA